MLQLDSDGDGSYGDEPPLADTWRVNMSDSLRASYTQLAAYDMQRRGTYSGTVESIDSSSGTITLVDGALVHMQGDAAPTVLSGLSSAVFNERTDIHQRTLGLGNSDIDVFSSLQAGDQVEIEMNRLFDSAESPQTLRLADRIVRVSGSLSADTIYAVPERTLVYPGESVRVTVSTTATASPLLSSMVQITYPDNCHYKPGSFNAGALTVDPDAWDIDGIWSTLGSTGFTTPGQDFAEAMLGGLNALTVPIQPIGATEQDGASGELFSFELVVNGDCALSFGAMTAYSGQDDVDHAWGLATNAGQPTIHVSGVRPQLALLSPIPGLGSGKAGNPYVVLPEQLEFQLALSSAGMNVTNTANTAYEVAPIAAGSVDSAGLLTIDPAFQGLLSVTGKYLNIPNTDESTLYFFSGPQLFSAIVDANATFAPGGSASGFSTVTSLVATSPVNMYEVKILGSNLQGLRALHFDLPFDSSQYRFAGYTGVNALEDADSRTLLLPTADPGLPLPVMIGSQARLRFGMAMAAFDIVSGYSNSGGAPLATLYFEELPGSYNDRVYTPPTDAPDSGPAPEFDGTEIQWYYYNHGDTNQDGVIDYRDFNPIAKYFGSEEVPGFPPHTVHDVVDCNNDDRINLADLLTVEEHFDQRVEEYQVYGGPLGSYPDSGIPLGDRQSLLLHSLGDENGSQRYFEFDISGYSYELYWVVPYAVGSAGVPSQPLYIP
nr:dockerin type I domain-containing protein [bacterium]